ncbi:MAG: DinB family protein [Bacteroidia bacterium]
MDRTKWTERKFNFDFPEGWIYNILERLRGTPARINDMTHSLVDAQTTFKPEGKWSIKEHIGHLADLEELHEGRIADFLLRKEILRAADMSNAKTNQANHNSKSIQQLLNNFSAKRKQFVTHLEKLDNETQYFKSMHPRLKVMMRPVDMAYFTAEHDDHHLATMREIAISF